MNASTIFWFAIISFAVWRRSMLVPVLFVAVVFQASSMLNFSIGSKIVPIMPYYFILICILCVGAVRTLLGAKFRLEAARSEIALLLLGFFLMWSAFSVFVGPIVFQGLPVYVPGVSIDAQFHNMGRLQFSVSMVGQLLYLFLNFSALFVLAFVLRDGLDPVRAFRAVGFATGVVFFVAIWQMLHNLYGVWFPYSYIYTAKGWGLGYDQILGGYRRINASFTEPSTLSVFMLGVLGFWVRFLVERFSWLALLLVISSSVVLLLTSSATAYLGVIVLGLFVIWKFVFIPFSLRFSMSRGAAFLVSLGGLAILAILMLYFFEPSFAKLVDVSLLNKESSDSFSHRFAADGRAFEIFLDTFGLGVGLGGNRPSGFLMSLLSNVGIFGVMFFVGSLLALTFRRRASHLQSVDNLGLGPLLFNASSWALWMTFFGMAVSVPDLSFPPLWIWIYVLVLLDVECRQLANRSVVDGCSA